MTSSEFEASAHRIMAQFFGTEWRYDAMERLPKRFDMVSLDGQIIGDAKYYQLVNRISLPPAKFAAIAEHVWLLEKTEAKIRFLVFGNQIEVPRLWLARYGPLAKAVRFFFLHDNGMLNELT
jgi:hypothetical protein